MIRLHITLYVFEHIFLVETNVFLLIEFFMGIKSLSVLVTI